MSLSALLYAFLTTIGILLSFSLIRFCIRFFGLACYQKGVTEGYYACLIKAGNSHDQALEKMRNELVIINSQKAAKTDPE